MNSNAYGPPHEQMFMGLAGLPPRADLAHGIPLGLPPGADRVTGLLPGQLPGGTVAQPIPQPQGGASARPAFRSLGSGYQLFSII